MSSDTQVMEAVLSGMIPGREHFEDYYRAFHSEHESATEAALRGFTDERGRSTYERLADTLAVPHGGLVLDIGCGDAPLLECLIARRPDVRVSGIDLSSAEIARAATRLPERNVDRLIEGSAASLSFPDAAFDAVASHMVLMLIPDVDRVFAEVRRVLRPLGLFAFLIPRPGNPEDAVAQLLRAIPQWIREVHPGYAPINPGDTRVWSVDTLSEALRSSGFARIETDDFLVERTVDAEQLRDIIRRRYYVGSLPYETRVFVDERLRDWCNGRVMTYREAMRIVRAG